MWEFLNSIFGEVSTNGKPNRVYITMRGVFFLGFVTAFFWSRHLDNRINEIQQTQKDMNSTFESILGIQKENTNQITDLIKFKSDEDDRQDGQDKNLIEIGNNLAVINDRMRIRGYYYEKN